MLAVVEVYGVLGEPHYHDVVGDRILSRAAVHGVGGKPIVHADIVVAFSTIDDVCAAIAKDQVGGCIARYLIIAVASVWLPSSRQSAPVRPARVVVSHLCSSSFLRGPSLSVGGPYFFVLWACPVRRDPLH